MKRQYFSKNHSSFLLKYHIILVVKYRKELLDKTICKTLDGYFNEKFDDFRIDFVGYDKDRLHLMVNSTPKLSPLQIVRKIKQETTILIWKNIDLTKFFWKKKHFGRMDILYVLVAKYHLIL